MRSNRNRRFSKSVNNLSNVLNGSLQPEQDTAARCSDHPLRNGFLSNVVVKIH